MALYYYVIYYDLYVDIYVSGVMISPSQTNNKAKDMSRLVSIRGGYKKPIKFLSVRGGDMTKQDIDKVLAYADKYLDMGVEVRDYHRTNLDT